MRSFLGLLMVLIVSGDDETINGILEDSVLLPCKCAKRNSSKEFQWQMEKPNQALVLNHKRTTNLYGRYEGRAKIFLTENSDNCSVLLTNLTAEDQGEYRCSFHSQEMYDRIFVNLNISASYSVCQKDSTNNLNVSLSEKVFQCDVKGRYREAEIQWKSDRRLFTNSPTTNITNTYTLDALTGLYHFKSTFTTKLNWTSEPKCDVKAKGISAIISYDCGAKTERQESPAYIRTDQYLKIIPIMLVLGASLVLWCRSRRIYRR